MGSTENKKNIKYEINDYLQISLKINSLLNLCDNGWEFEIQNENSFQKKNYNYVISTIGNKANGKNYFFKKLIINKLASLKNNIIDEINNYFLDNSEGIKLFLPLYLESYIYYINTLSLNSPILNKEINEKEINDNEINEINKNIQLNQKLIEIKTKKNVINYFILRFSIFISNMIILIINEITLETQKLITNVKNLINNINNESDKIITLIIVHNLKFYDKISDVENYINYKLKNSCFNIDEEKNENEKNSNFFYEKDIYKYKAIHIVIAKENTEAGVYYNDSAFTFINSLIINYEREFNFFDSLKMFVKIMSQKIFDKKICRKNIKIISLSNDNNKVIKKFLVEKKFKLNNNLLNIFNLEKYDNFKIDLIPKNKYIFDDNFLNIIIYCSGESKIINYKISKLNDDKFSYLIEIEGEKKIFDSDSIEMLYNFINEGKFKIDIKIEKKNKIVSEKSKMVIEKKNGLIICKFKLKKYNKINCI